MSLITHMLHAVCCAVKQGCPFATRNKQDVLTPRQTDDKHVQHMSVTNTQPDLAPFFDSDKAFVFFSLSHCLHCFEKNSRYFVYLCLFFPQVQSAKAWWAALGYGCSIF